MKKIVFILPVLLIGLSVIIWNSCETEPEESCLQDEFCEGHMVTACCTDTECVYKFNGEEYGDSDAELDRLAADLGCTAILVQREDGSFEKDYSAVKERLRELLLRVQEETNTIK